MEVTTAPRRLWPIEKVSRYFRYCWKKLVRHVTIDSPPIFIVGCGHSGTSLLLAILGAHSRIYAVPFESRMANKPRRFQKRLKEFDKSTILAEKHRWAEKTPKHIHQIGKILKWSPGAKILLVIRDGRDVACSIQARTGSLESGIRRWVKDNLAGKEYFDNPNVHVVKYENLVSDFEFTVRDVLGFLNEEYEDGVKDYHKSTKKWYSNDISKPSTPFGINHEQYRNWQINQPLFDGRGRWKNMSAEELSLVNDIAREMLVEFGYI